MKFAEGRVHGTFSLMLVYTFPDGSSHMVQADEVLGVIDWETSLPDDDLHPLSAYNYSRGGVVVPRWGWEIDVRLRGTVSQDRLGVTAIGTHGSAAAETASPFL